MRTGREQYCQADDSSPRSVGCEFDDARGRSVARLGPEAEVTESHIKWILSVRRERRSVFGNSLFSDPAWDILLELLAAKLARRTVALADLGHIAASSILARWVAALEERGLVVCDASNGPDRMLVAVSPDAAARMISFLGGAPHAAD